MTDPVSTEELLQRWRNGDQTAAEDLYHRYARRLCELAQRRIGPRLGRRVGAEDVVQSAFRTFFRRSAEGEYAVDQSGSLWNLLVRITLNKIRRQGQRHHARKRDVAVEIYPGEWELSPEIAAREPSPEDAAALLDELEAATSGLMPPEPEIVHLCFEGYSTSEIAQKVGVSRWTVRRVLDRIGHLLRRRLGTASENS